MNNPTLIKSYLAASVIAGHHIIKNIGGDNEVQHADASDALIMGISERMGAENGSQADVVKAGIYPVKLGGTVSAGEPVTANATGEGIKAVPEAGKSVRYVGFAEQDGVAGDLVDVSISLGVINNP